MADHNNRSDDAAAQAAELDTEVLDSELKPGLSGTSAEEQAELSRKAQQNGESRKRLASSLIKMAASGSKDAKTQLMELASDERERVYLESKFGEEFTSLFQGEQKVAPSELNEKLIEQVNHLVEKDKASRNSQKERVKAALGLSLEKGDTFDDLVKTFEGKNVGGKTIDFEGAVEMAAQQLSPGSPSASTILRGGVQARPEDAADEVDVPITDEFISRHTRFTKSTSKKDYEGIVKQVANDGVYSPKL
jgi:hypothetical protein